VLLGAVYCCSFWLDAGMALLMRSDWQVHTALFEALPCYLPAAQWSQQFTLMCFQHHAAWRGSFGCCAPECRQACQQQLITYIKSLQGRAAVSAAPYYAYDADIPVAGKC
jgi:hypothetical protein